MDVPGQGWLCCLAGVVPACASYRNVGTKLVSLQRGRCRREDWPGLGRGKPWYTSVSLAPGTRPLEQRRCLGKERFMN